MFFAYTGEGIGGNEMLDIVSRGLDFSPQPFCGCHQAIFPLSLIGDGGKTEARGKRTVRANIIL